MSKYFIEPFAQNGNKLVIPDDLQTNGSVSYTEGFGFDYQRNLTNDPLAKPFPRQGFNGLIYDITDAIKQYQEQGFYDFITTEMNGGTAFPYSMGAVVRYDMSDDGSDVRNFSSKINNNTGNPKDNPDDWSDISDNDLVFATFEEIANGLAGKPIDPAGLLQLTSTTLRRGLIQLATQDEVNGGTNTTKSVTPATLKSNLDSRATVIYPNGTEASPFTITRNQRIVIPNDFNTMNLLIIVEVKSSASSSWGSVNWVYASNTSNGVSAKCLSDGTIVITSGTGYIYNTRGFDGNPFEDTAVQSASLRLRITVLGA